jgi:hypothetical protein
LAPLWQAGELIRPSRYCGHMAALEKPRELAMLLGTWIETTGL